MAKPLEPAPKAITLRLSYALAERVRQNAKARKISVSRLIADMIQTHVQDGPNGRLQALVPDALIKLGPKVQAQGQEPISVDAQKWGRWSARLDARFDKAIGETLIIKEALLLFVRVWLEHHPELEEHLQESAGMSAEARFERYLDLLAYGLKNNQSVAAAASLIARAADDERALAQAAAKEGR